MKKHYNYAFIEGSDITLFNESVLCRTVFGTDFLENVDIYINENNDVCEINADKLNYDFYTEDTFEEGWINEPNPKLIKSKKRYFWSSKKERYVKQGWVRTTVKTPIKYILNQYKITILP